MVNHVTLDDAGWLNGCRDVAQRARSPNAIPLLAWCIGCAVIADRQIHALPNGEARTDGARDLAVGLVIPKLAVSSAKKALTGHEGHPATIPRADGTQAMPREIHALDLTGRVENPALGVRPIARVDNRSPHVYSWVIDATETPIVQSGSQLDRAVSTRTTSAQQPDAEHRADDDKGPAPPPIKPRLTIGNRSHRAHRRTESALGRALLGTAGIGSLRSRADSTRSVQCISPP